MKNIICRVVTFFVASLLASQVNAQFVNQTYSTQADLLSHSAPVMGRLAIIETLGDYVITIPERPSSPQGSDFIVRAWDISDPSNPQEVARFGTTTHPFDAHGMIKRGNQILLNPYIRDGRQAAIQLNSDGSLSIADWQGIGGLASKGGMMRPWGANTFWTYGPVSGNADLWLDGVQTASWDHLALTGVAGFPVFMGNILIYASDQSLSGVATYDISDPANPVLLDTFNLPATHPSLTYRRYANGGVESYSPVYGLGGYWSEISGDYLVFVRRGDNPGLQVVDISDPSNIRHHCDFFAREAIGMTNENGNRSPGIMYLGFQDQYAFAGPYKVDLTDCSLANPLQEEGVNSAGQSYAVDTTQYARPIGNLVLTGGQGTTWWWNATTNGAGLGIWVHDTNPDTNPPYVASHVPRADQTNYPTVAPISVSIPESIRTVDIVIGQHIRVDEVNGSSLSPIAIDYVFSHTGMLTINPVNNLSPNTTYQVTLTGIRDSVGNAMAPYTYRFSTGNSVSGGGGGTPVNNPPVINSINLPSQVNIGDTINASVQASDVDGDSLEYRYQLSGSSFTAWSSSNQFTTSINSAGTYSIRFEVRDTSSAAVSQNRSFSVVDPTPPPPSPTSQDSIHHSQVGFHAASNSIWVVNPDNNSVSQIDAASQTLINEYNVGNDPRSIVINGNEAWVSLFDDDRIVVINTANGSLINSIDTGYGSAPYALLKHPSNNEMYASLYNSGELIKINSNTKNILNRLQVGNTARALALTPDGNNLYATRFITQGNWAEVWQVNTSSFNLVRTIPLYKQIHGDTLDNGNGLPNYLSSIIVNPAGTLVYVTGKKDNVDRGLLNNTADLDHDNTVRTFLTTIDISTGQEVINSQFDFDNADSPAALSFSADGNSLFVAIQGRNEIFVVDTTQSSLAVSAQFLVGLAPQGLYLNTANNELYVKNFTDRSLSIIDLTNFFANGSLNPSINHVSSVNNENLSANVLAGKQIFYNAKFGNNGAPFIGNVSSESYISCATCHTDGDADGSTYDFTGRGEGLRNNISLKGRGGTRFGNVHWTGNFDEIQDFENDMRQHFAGSGLMSDADFAATQDVLGQSKTGRSQDLDNLAAYVSSLNKASLPKSPHRLNSGALSDAALRGEQVFTQENCSSCHQGKAFTDGQIHDVGTIRSSSGQRLGGTLTGFKTPSLLALFETAPYLHDGSAATLDDVFLTSGGTLTQAENAPDITGTIITTAASALHSPLRSGQAVMLSSGQQFSIDLPSNAGGQGMIAIRYGSSSSAGQINIVIEGGGAVLAQQNLALKDLPQVNGLDVNFVEDRVLVNMPVNTGAEVAFTFTSSISGDTVIVDEVSIANPAQYASANAHNRVNALSSSDQTDLKSFLLQLDQNSAPEDSEDALNPTSTPTGDSSSDGSADDDASANNSGDREEADSNDDEEVLTGSGSAGILSLLFLIIIVLTRRKIFV